MAAILNGFLPLRKKDQVEDRVLNTRWGDTAITAPMHGGWNTIDSTIDHVQDSPDLDRDLPPTPPQDNFDEQDGVFIVEDEDETDRDPEKDSITVTIPLPWKRKKQPSHVRKSSYNGVLNPKFAAPKRMDIMPPLGTLEAAAIPLPDSRVSSPVGRASTTSPVLSFRTRLASPNLGDILSPVAEGFAKEGPSHRPTPVLSPLQFVQTVQADRPSTASSIRSNASRRPSINGHTAEGLMGSTMSSQAIVDEQAPDYVRPPSRGIGATACMRSSSRGPRASSRGPRAPSVEPFARRAPSVEPIGRRAPSVEPIGRRAPSIEPVSRRAPSVEPLGRRAPSIEPIGRRRDPSVDSTLRFRRPLDEVVALRREPSPEPLNRERDASPVRRRAPSVEPIYRRAPSIGPAPRRRAISREPRGRRGLSVEPARVRFRSEAPYRHRREDSDSSANDASADSDSEAEGRNGRDGRFNRFDNDFKSSSRTYRRRSIASPITSPTHTTFNVAAVVHGSANPIQANSITSMSAGPGLTRPSPPPVPVMTTTPPPVTKPVAPRARSISRTRGLYGDMRDDFRLLGRDVHIATNMPIQPQMLERIPSPITCQRPVSINGTLAHSQALDYSSDASLPSTQYQPYSGFARERPEYQRRDERERAREQLVKKLERDRDLMLSGDESAMSGSENKTRRVYGGNINIQGDQRPSGKTMVPDADEMWG